LVAASTAACLLSIGVAPAAASVRPGPDSIGEVLGWDQWSGWSVELPTKVGLTGARPPVILTCVDPMVGPFQAGSAIGARDGRLAAVELPVVRGRSSFAL